MRVDSLTCSRELWEARSRPYRRRLLQVNTRWKVLGGIYLAPLDLKHSAKLFSLIFLIFHIFQHFVVILMFNVEWWNFVGISRIFSEWIFNWNNNQLSFYSTPALPRSVSCPVVALQQNFCCQSFCSRQAVVRWKAWSVLLHWQAFSVWNIKISWRFAVRTFANFRMSYM